MLYSSITFPYQNEVARAIEIREIVTSLGPAYIKLGQALSIRPDILSPVAMAELQKLCDKVKYMCPCFLFPSCSLFSRLHLLAETLCMRILVYFIHLQIVIFIIQ